MIIAPLCLRGGPEKLLRDLLNLRTGLGFTEGFLVAVGPLRSPCFPSSVLVSIGPERVALPNPGTFDAALDWDDAGPRGVDDTGKLGILTLVVRFLTRAALPSPGGGRAGLPCG